MTRLGAKDVVVWVTSKVRLDHLYRGGSVLPFRMIAEEEKGLYKYAFEGNIIVRRRAISAGFKKIILGAKDEITEVIVDFGVMRNTKVASQVFEFDIEAAKAFLSIATKVLLSTYSSK